MRILFTPSNDSVPWGGSEELWFLTAKYALEQGHDVAVCVLWNPLPNKLLSLMAFENFFLIEKNSKSRIFNNYLPNRLKKTTELHKNKIVDWNPTIAIVSQGNNADGIELMLFFQQHNIQYISISQAVYEGIWPDNYKVNQMKMVYNLALANCFVSEANLKLTECMIASKVKNSKVIRNPFNVPYTNEIAFPDSNVTYRLACVARFEFYAKGQDVLLEVLNEKKWRERNIEVNFYGNGKNEEGLKALINYFSLDNAFIKGFSNTLDIWRFNHALVLPSRFEGLPLALVEAMLCGRFGIVSDVSGNNEVFENNISGFLAEAPKAEYFDLAMERAWGRRNEWESIGQMAKSKIKMLVPENPERELYNLILSTKL